MASFVGIGCMSGSSLDGLDICCVEFTGDICMDLWGYRILHAETAPYSPEWTQRLRDAPTLSGEDLIKLHLDYGKLVGRLVASFLKSNNIHGVQFISSHGHTVFHKPKDGLTFQLGDGEATSTFLRVPFVTSFRSKDVCFGGEGAPLVPCGEKYLFRNNYICINLGGIANIGIGGEIGYDISPCNILLNRLAALKDPTFLYDNDGEMARSGKVQPDLLQILNSLSYYSKKAPKSLWKDYIESHFFPALNTDRYSIEDLLCTCTDHIAMMVAEACVDAITHMQHSNHPNILVTGGGAFNKFLMERITARIKGFDCSIDQVDENTINYKEALIFAFLGLRCLLGEENVFKETTGALKDTISGSIHRPMIAGKHRQCSLLHFSH